MPLPLSIIIPVFQTEKYLERCISSVLCQDFADFQLILVNDGSSDGSGKICDLIAKSDKRVKVLHQQNLGVVRAIKNGLAYAEGDYIGFVDSDDTIKADMYSRLMSKIYLQPDIVACGWSEVYADKIVPSPLSIPSGVYEEDRIEEVIYPTLLEQDGDIKHAALKISRVNKIYKKALILPNLNYYKEGITVSEDYSFYLATALDAKKICVLENELLYNYHIHKDSTTAQKRPDFWQESLLCMRSLHSIIEKKGRPQFSERIDLLATRFAATAIARTGELKKAEAKAHIKDILATPEVASGLRISSRISDPRMRILIALMQKGKVDYLYLLSRLYRLIKK